MYVHTSTHLYTPVWHKDEYVVIIGIKLDIGLSSLMLLYLDRKAEVLGWNHNPAIFFSLYNCSFFIWCNETHDPHGTDRIWDVNPQ